jgi:hypothetical protein
VWLKQHLPFDLPPLPEALELKYLDLVTSDSAWFSWVCPPFVIQGVEAGKWSDWVEDFSDRHCVMWVVRLEISSFSLTFICASLNLASHCRVHTKELVKQNDFICPQALQDLYYKDLSSGLTLASPHPISSRKPGIKLDAYKSFT